MARRGHRSGGAYRIRRVLGTAVIATAVIALPLALAVVSLLPPLARRTRPLTVVAGLAVAVLGFTGPMLPVRASVHAPWAPILGLSYAVELDAFAAIFVAATGLVFAAVVASGDRIGHARAYHALLSVLLRETHGDKRKAVAGYYQGLASVRSRGMFTDTKRYVRSVLALRNQF